jgi:myo-inositol-1(or 4)-monophosphatase
VIEWVRAAGALARDRLGRAVASRKADESVVTDADHAVQEMILEHIGREFPSDAVIAEETQPLPHRHAAVSTARRCWVIDPIDGTRNYARAFPIFSVAVALMERGRPIIGVIHNPMTGEMYSASLGGGAWWDERRLHVRDEPMSAGSLIAVPSARRGPLPGFLHRWVDRMVLRNVGSTALHLALVGSGAIDAAYVDDCRLWDVAAGAIIAAEAGAVVVRPDGGPAFPLDVAAYREQDVPMLAAGPKLARQLLADMAA